MNGPHPSSHPGSAGASRDGSTAASTDAEPAKDDGVLDSLGKAITSPVRGAAEPEEPAPAERRAPVPPG